MIFNSLSLFQNIIFIIACMGVLLLITFIICVSTGAIKKDPNTTSDDIDNADEDFKEPRKFVYNAFTIKGSIFFVAITTSIGFFLSLFLNTWLSLGIGAIVAIVTALLAGFLDREKLSYNGELGIVSEDIPENCSGLGKIIIESDGTEIISKTTGKKTLKKGKKVVIIENVNNIAIVKKYKRH